jgi:hypothetical protein
VKWWTTSWLLIKDVALTGTGLWLIYRQAISAVPSDVLLTVGLALIAPSVYDHAKAVLSGPTAGRSSSSPPPGPVSPSPPSSSEEVAGNGPDAAGAQGADRGAGPG